MRCHAGEGNFCRCRIEVFIHHFAEFAAVDGVSKIDIKAGEIQRLGTAQTNFFVRHKRHHDIAVFLLSRQVFQQCHHHRHCRFIIRTQHTGAVAENNILTFVRQDFRAFRRAQPDIQRLVQTHILTGKTQCLRMNIRAQADIHGIDMRDKTDTRPPFFGAGFDCRHGGMFIDLNIFQTQLMQFFSQQPRHVVLARRAG
ncbi:hypothetical protein SRABI106_03461 [Rahnella aquatilis]|nr:hypothetical protein SRABI106_03461 [Rahnella aquatilis]